MKQTACQPTGGNSWTAPLPIQDRPQSVYHGTERIQKWVRRGNLWLGALILTCAMILSYSHTADLFRWAFYDGWLAHVGVIMVELTFFLGAMNIILARSAGLRAGWPARVTFVFGALLVGWSNVSSGRMFLSREDTAVALGLAIPVCLFLMEAIVSRALFQFRIVRHQTDGHRTAGQSDTSDRQTGIGQQQDRKPSGVRTLAGRTEVTDTRTEQTDIPDSWTVKESDSESDSRTAAEASDARRADNRTDTDQTPNTRAVVGQTNIQRKASVPKPDNRTGTGQKPDTRTIGQQTIRQSDTQTPGQPDTVHNIIREIIESEGRPPSIRQLAEKAGVSKYRAERALREWKEKKMKVAT